MTLEELKSLEHITFTEEKPHPTAGRCWKVITDRENGWYINLDTWTLPEDEEFSIPKMYKWCTFLYEIDDISAVNIVHISEVPEGSDICRSSDNIEIV